MTGPNVTAGSKGSPTVAASMTPRNLSTKASYTDSCTSETACAGTTLARLHQRALMRRQRGRSVEIGIGEHDVGRLAAQFGHDGREIDGGRLHHRPSGLATTGEMDLADAGMADEGLPTFGTGGHDVDQSRRQAGLEAQFAEPQRGQWRQFGRLEHHGITRRQRRRHARRRHRQRAVPRGDDPDDAVRFPLDEVHVERAVDRCADAVWLVDVSGEMAQKPFQQ